MSVRRLTRILLIAEFLFLLESCLSADRLVWAEEAISFERRISAVELLDRELAQAKKQLKEEKSTLNRRKLQIHIQDLERKQEQNLQELERIVGPLPPAVRSERSVPLEQVIKQQERHQEKALEADVERRLPNK